MEIKCEIKVKRPKHNLDLKAYKREGQDGTITYYGYSNGECARIRKKLNVD